MWSAAISSATVTSPIVLAPGFRARASNGDPWMDALGAAPTGEPGTVFWSGADGWCRAAILLTPGQPITGDTLLSLGLVAVLDALAVLAPVHVPLQADGDTIRVDGGAAGRVRSAQDDRIVPRWAVLAFEVAVDPGYASPGDAPDETALAEEGFADVTPAAVLRHSCRHLLGWIDVWHEEGDAALERGLAPYRPRRPAA